MPELSKQVQRRIKLAARMQIEGNTWAQIAPHIGRRNENTARHITAEHPEEWREAVTEAREAYLGSVEAEALLTQRELTRPLKPMRDESGQQRQNPDGSAMLQERDEKIRQSAAHSLLAHTAKLYAQKVTIDATVNGGVDQDAVAQRVEELAAEMVAPDAEGGEEHAHGGDGSGN